MRRRLLAGIAALIVLGAAGWLVVPVLARVKAPVRVGLLHSMTGPMAISEASMIEAEVLAIEELNAAGGLLGRRVEWVKADGKSDPETFAREAERLIRDEKVVAIFGCWTSACRKSVKPVVERLDHLLIYPVAYEGLEQSPNILYTGAAPNQQIIPTVKWALDVLKAKTFFLIGSESVWPRAVNAIIKDQLTALGGTVVGEEYVGADAGRIDAVVARAVKAAPDLILSTLEGETNLPFYKAFRGGGDNAKTPVVSFSMAEDELRQLPLAQMVNDYAVCNYFQAVDRPENLAFVRRFQARYGRDRVTSDAIATAYSSVGFWAQAVREAETDEVGVVRDFLLQQSLDAPEGVISVDRETRHTWRPFFVGRVRPDGQFDILLTVSKPIRPVPFPFSRTRQEWEAFLETLRQRWGGNWSRATARGPGRSAS